MSGVSGICQDCNRVVGGQDSMGIVRAMLNHQDRTGHAFVLRRHVEPEDSAYVPDAGRGP